MLSEIKDFIRRQQTLEDRIFVFMIIIGAIVTGASTIATVIEDMGLFASLSSIAASAFMIGLLLKALHSQSLRGCRTAFCCAINFAVLPAAFFSCGGIDSGMPLYFMGGLFIVLPSLTGRRRIVMFILSMLVFIGCIAFSYLVPSSTARLELSGRFVDVAASLFLMGIFTCGLMLLTVVAYDRERAAKNELLDRLQELAVHDELTNLYNRRGFFARLDRMSSPERNGCHVAMFDIDNFKVVNDTYGHIFGDKVLVRIAAEIQNVVNAGDDEIAVRYGGEEFVCLVKGEDPQKIFARTDQLRRSIYDLHWDEAPGLRISISGGLAEGEEDMMQALYEADCNLFQAKADGKNLIVV